MVDANGLPVTFRWARAKPMTGIAHLICSTASSLVRSCWLTALMMQTSCALPSRRKGLGPISPPCPSAGTNRLSVRSSTNIETLVERFFRKLKNARRLATRYDKIADNYLGFIHLLAIRLGMQQFGNTA